MLTRARARARLGARGRVLTAAAVIAALLIGGAVLITAKSEGAGRTLCAHLPDAAGLYVGNAVNIRGVRVGEVTEVSPGPGAVNVRMRIGERRLDAGLSVVAVNNSVLADRRIELVGAQDRGGPELAPDACVPRERAFTPISVSSAFQSFTSLFDDLGAPGSDAQRPLAGLLTQLDKQVAGTGADLNATIKNVAGFMADPNEFLAQLRAVFDNLAVLTSVAGENWEAIKELSVNAADLTHFMGALFESFVYIFDGLGMAGPGIDDLLSNVVPPILDASDDLAPVTELGLARLDDLTAILKELPGIAVGLRTAVSRSGGLGITVASPRVVAASPNSAALCAAMNTVDPGSCDPRTPRTAAVDLGLLVTRLVQGGAR